MKSIIILGIAFIFLLIPPAYGSHTCSHSSYTLTDSKAINVGRASEYTYYFSVEKGDYVAIDLQVTGGRDNDVYITVQNSRGEVGNQGMVENSIQLERFTALYSGQYRLVLGNEHSLIHGKSVGLEIKITRNFDQLDMERICDIERAQERKQQADRTTSNNLGTLFTIAIFAIPAIIAIIVTVRYVSKNKKEIKKMKNPKKYLEDEYQAGYNESKNEKPIDNSKVTKPDEKNIDDVKNLGILKERLAKGEITKKEYDELKKEFE